MGSFLFEAFWPGLSCESLLMAAGSETAELGGGGVCNVVKFKTRRIPSHCDTKLFAVELLPAQHRDLRFAHTALTNTAGRLCERPPGSAANSFFVH